MTASQDSPLSFPSRPADSDDDDDDNTGREEHEHDTPVSPKNEQPGLCCFYLKYGNCDPPRPPCRFRHDRTDDGVTPCCFGATCRLGHAKRVLSKGTSPTAKAAYWKAYHERTQHHTTGSSPAVRDATQLQSQLEPLSTAVLRQRLATVFDNNVVTPRQADELSRGRVMEMLLQQYDQRQQQQHRGPRRVVRVQGTPVDPTLCRQLLGALQAWRRKHATNTRPSIHATSYMILRSPHEFQSKANSQQAKKAAKRLQQYDHLWKLACQALRAVDAEYAANFSALAVTYGFRGSPHIDKQNTGPFYGLALGDFPDGQGGICVEADPLTVAVVNTKHRLGKVDGRYPHWVAPYDDGERYSLIYYSTWQTYQKPGPAYFGTAVEEEEERAVYDDKTDDKDGNETKRENESTHDEKTLA